jgi:crotonobetainyl-CoA:carnitine CoA-transferase CaiB-like acyl-CoA transferase
MVDLGAGEHGYGQVMKALYRRAMTGQGTRVDISMFRSGVSWMMTPLLLAASFGEAPRRTGTRHPHFAPVSVYRTADGYLYLAVGSDRQWAALVALAPFAGLGRAEYERNAGRIAAVDALDRELAPRFSRLRTAETLALLRDAGIPVSPVQTIAQVLADPLVARDLVRVADPRSGLTVVLPAPVAGPAAPLRFPPRLGEHNGAVYGSALGLSPDELTDLASRGII